jgi:hypothetical protein
MTSINMIWFHCQNKKLKLPMTFKTKTNMTLESIYVKKLNYNNKIYRFRSWQFEKRKIVALYWEEMYTAEIKERVENKASRKTARVSLRA